MAYLLFLWAKFMLLSVELAAAISLLFGILPDIEVVVWTSLVEAVVYGFATGNLVFKSDHTGEWN